MKNYLSLFLLAILIIGLFVNTINGNGKFANASKKATPSVVSLWGYNSSQLRTSLNTMGSGVIFSKDGYVVTNYHVINNAKNIIIKIDDYELNANIIGFDKNSDIAILKIETQLDLEPISIGSSDNLRVGDEVLAIGNPYGIGISVTSGIISATGREYGNPYLNLIQTDAAINPGNSGGALINTKGNLIGINTKIYSKTGAYQGLGFAIPSEKIVQIASEIIKFGKVRKAWIGNFRVTSSQLLIDNKIYKSLKILEIEENKGIYNKGLRSDHHIIEVNGFQASWKNLTQSIKMASPGDFINIKYFDGKKLVNVDIEVKAR
jgi:S1-C subfamily serine protease